MRNDYIAGLNIGAPKYYKDQAERMEKQFETNATVTDGVVRWNSNGSIPPSDILEFWKYIGKEFDYDKTREVKEKETTEFFARYREAQKNRVPSEEEMFEMRAAFGEGATVVNVITGQRTQL